ncbi:UDP-N-acetylmuramoyl-L-alanyl-D-glutamate--2,6-diaminopimelate ligase [Nocardia asteroides]|uniref:UDP-N-acetylmuramoyl-L-alanyl-D-glutamate--2, 6-diaminopimelate ligase n=1 Tax=Nocardia asteroides TaxID=1824 RepID=UPI001E5830B3|nr:UDP-N-acetylmuramoyl-L-alanyl-D-glutamate--2,6-diaminopimelate ligase [Nocardia asteroides]UGT60702.1 UDP-N-acetylmuramoyl-L-alanyl-D-glutamate--2,6-diaminopimelate ligase [Nocardia asteroides]
MAAQSSPQTLRPAQPPSTPLPVLLEATGARSADPTADVDRATPTGVTVTGIEQRSNAVLAGDLFAALPGARAHGARFAADAVARGAVAIFTDPAGAAELGDLGVPVLVREEPRAVLGELSALIYGHPSQRLTIVGITGTSGKTTTSYLVEAGLAAAGLATGLIGTIETRIGGRRVPSALTTPEAPQLHAMFAAMVEQGVDAVVMEVSSHALALGRVDGVRFDVGAFTNLSQDHLDFHADFEDYFAAKRRLFEVGSPIAARTAVVCVDQEWGRRLAAALPNPVTVRTEPASPAGAEAAKPAAAAATDSARPTEDPAAVAADWTVAGDVTTIAGGEQEFVAAGPDGRIPVRLRLPGRYNVANGLLAVAVCAAAGVDAAQAAAALASVDVPGRMQRVTRGQNFLAVVDYAHKPAAVESVLATLRAQTSGRVAVVVGAGGDRDAGKRPLMGAAAARGADLTVITDDNPRSEDPATIRAALRAGALAVPEAERGEVREVGDRAAAVAAAVRWARAGDVVLIAGKGHETGQEIAGVKHPFDDREVLAAALAAIGSTTEDSRVP